MTFDAKLSVTEGLDHLSSRLDPIIESRLSVHLGGLPWTAVLTQLDQIAGRPPIEYTKTDLQPQLKMLTIRLGQLGYPFDDHRRTASTLGSELRIVRNAWAHGDPFSSLDAWRAHDYCVRLLEYFGDGEGLVKANNLRHQAVVIYVEEQGIAPTPVTAARDDSGQHSGPGSHEDLSAEPDAEMVIPDSEVYQTESAGHNSVVGESRLSFEPWEPVLVGDISVLDGLPKVWAKQKVRAVAAEIVEAEGPIHVDRLAQLVAASFGVGRLHTNRADKIVRQVKAAGLRIDKAKFVWPDELNPDTWTEFRPNSSQVDRPFLHVSPVEIANAMRFLKEHRTGLSTAELDSATLQTFGRRRRTRQFTAHLTKAKALL